MSTTTRSARFQPLLAALLLGLVMAAGIAVLAAPELAWIGFAMAGTLGAATPSGRACVGRRRRA